MSETRFCSQKELFRRMRRYGFGERRVRKFLDTGLIRPWSKARDCAATIYDWPTVVRDLELENAGASNGEKAR